MSEQVQKFPLEELSDEDKEHLQLKHIENLDEEFKNWVEMRRDPGTARTYWSRLKKFPYFELRNDDSMEISGKLNKTVKNSGDVTAIRQFVQFLYEEWEKEEIPDKKYEKMRRKKNAVKGSIELTEQTKTKQLTPQEIENKHIQPFDLVKMLRKAKPERARLWFVLYSGAFRMGEIKRLTPTHLRGKDRLEPYGGIQIPDERSKSEKSRTWQFLNKYVYEILQDAPTGEWTDENGNSWENVFYPEPYSQLEKHYTEKYTSHDKHGIGIERKTPHCFRHTRITHLVYGYDEYDIDDVRRRVGHGDLSTTRKYIETQFEKEPETLESYCDRKGISIMSVIEEN